MRTRSYSLLRAFTLALGCAAFAGCGGGGGGGGAGPLNITTTAADDGVIGAAYSEAIAATGGSGAKTFNISAGALPAGLTMSAAGAISGTPTGPAGTASFTVTVTDSAATPATDSQALTIDVVEPLAITTASLPDTSVGDAYSATVSFSGGTPPYQLSTSAPLPSGIALQTDGTLAGTVAASARTANFDVIVSDSSSPALTATRSYRIRVALDITTTAFADASGGVAYSDTAVAQGGLPPFAWSLAAGALPAGLTGPDPVTGAISGTPDPVCAPATATLSLAVSDSDSPVVSDTQAGIDLTVNPAALSFTTSALPNATLGVAYNQRIVATGGKPPYAFSLTGGILPSQLVLAADGRIQGTPDTLETQAFEVTVTDDCGVTSLKNLSLTVSNASLGRNDSIAEATILPGNGSYSASISPAGEPTTVFDPDEDYYRIQTSAASTITIDVNAQVNGSPLDSVIEVVNASGTVLNLCGSPTFTSPCISDDEELGVSLDSFLQIRVNGATTLYIHVVDWSMIARPDMLYDLVISGIN